MGLAQDGAADGGVLSLNLNYIGSARMGSLMAAAAPVLLHYIGHTADGVEDVTSLLPLSVSQTRTRHRSRLGGGRAGDGDRRVGRHAQAVLRRTNWARDRGRFIGRCCRCCTSARRGHIVFNMRADRRRRPGR